MQLHNLHVPFELHVLFENSDVGVIPCDCLEAATLVYERYLDNRARLREGVSSCWVTTAGGDLVLGKRGLSATIALDYTAG
jgi:hypothetical protein